MWMVKGMTDGNKDVPLHVEGDHGISTADQQIIILRVRELMARAVLKQRAAMLTRKEPD